MKGTYYIDSNIFGRKKYRKVTVALIPLPWGLLHL